MSTYTDLHNRVQESINVDYNSRITPQKVKLLNEENEYWGTFKGTMQVENIALSGGSLSDVTLKNVVIDGARFTNVDDLEIRMDDYVTKLELNDYKISVDDKLTSKTASIETSATKALASADVLNTRINDLTATVNGINATIEGQINSKLANISAVISGDIIRANSVADGADAIAKAVRDELNTTIQDKINTKINITESDFKDQLLSTNLTTLINGPTGTIATVSSNIVSLVDGYLQLNNDVDDALCTDIKNEISARISDDAILSNAIDSIYKSENSIESGKLVDVSVALKQDINTEASTRYRNDEHLSNMISGLSGEHMSEVMARGVEDGRLCAKILSVEHDYISSDNAINEILQTTSVALDEKIDTTKIDVLSILEHDRHYILNNAANGHATTAFYPLSAKDMAVNVFNTTLPNARLIYTEAENGIYAEIAQVTRINDILQVKTYADLENKHAGIAKGLLDDTVYDFSRLEPLNVTLNGYTFEYICNNADDLLDSENKFKLRATLLSYYNLILSGTQTIVGKVFDLSVDGGSVISGKYNIELRPTDELYPFNQFKGIAFNNTTTLMSTIGSNRIVYNSNNTFELQYGVHNVPYFDIYDRTKNFFIGRVYSKAGTEDGILTNNYNDITCIRVNDLENDSTRYTYLNTENKFCAVLSSYVNTNNQRRYNRYLSADIDGSIATFTQYDAARLHKYPFSFTSFESDSDPECVGYVVPILYNMTIEEQLVKSPFIMFSFVDVDLSLVVVADCFKKKYRLNKVGPGQNVWTTSDLTADGHIDITYSNFNMLKVHYVVNKPLDEIQDDDQAQQNEFTHILYVSMIPEPDSYEGDTGTTLNQYTVSIDLSNTFFNADYEDYDSRDYIEKSYYASFDNGNPITATLTPYTLDIETNEMSCVKIVIPAKKDYEDPTYDISREMLLVLKFNSDNNEIPFVNVLLIKEEDGKPVTFYNNKKQEITLETNRWTTLQLNEIQPNRFLVTDLNLNEDRLKFAALSIALSTEIDTRTNETSYLSGEFDALSNIVSANTSDIAWLSNELSDTMRFKGDVLLSDDYNTESDPHDDHRHLSMLLKTCVNDATGIAFDENYVFERGYLFRCKAPELSIANTFTFIDSLDSTTELSLDNNDYLLIKKDCILADARISDIEIIKDFKNYIARLSAASDDKYVMLSGNNNILGNNRISNLTAESLSAIDFVGDNGKLSSLSVEQLSVANEEIVSSNISNLSATEISSTNIVANNISATTALSATSATVVNASISALSTDSIFAKVLTNLTGNVSSFTAESAYVSAMSATDVSALKTTDVSAYVSNLTANDAYVDAMSATALSANSLSATALSVSSLSGTDVSVENLIVDNLSGTNLSIEKLVDVSACISTLSANDISVGKLVNLIGNVSSFTAESAYVSAMSATSLSIEKLVDVSACISSLSVNALSNIIDNNTTSSLQDTVDDLDTRIDTISVVVDDALSAGCELPTHSHENVDHSITNLTAIVSKLLLVDEATYDVYALTMRNGALNVDKVGHWPDKHPHPHSK